MDNIIDLSKYDITPESPEIPQEVAETITVLHAEVERLTGYLAGSCAMLEDLARSGHSVATPEGVFEWWQDYKRICNEQC